MRQTLDYDIVHLADNEWDTGGTMVAVARDWFDRFPDCRAVLVYEHGGWSLGYDRQLRAISSANDMAFFPSDLPRLGCYTGREQRRPGQVHDGRVMARECHEMRMAA